MNSRQVKLPPELRAALSTLAVAEGLSLSTLILLLINEALDRRLSARTS
jgi:hypothetical protein